jgi:hypothetical protein
MIHTELFQELTTNHLATSHDASHSYRVEGPTFQIEFVNFEKDAAGNPANHIHFLWRDVRGGFATPAK